MDRKKRIVVITIVALHMALLAAYTFPERLVPQRLAFLAQAYVRPLFHQRWELFAPDPPLCSCEVQVGLNEADWRPLHASDAKYLTRRMARTIAWHVQAEVASGRVPSEELQQAMRSMVRDIGREAPGLQFRLVQHCVIDPARPTEREERIVPLAMR